MPRSSFPPQRLPRSVGMLGLAVLAVTATLQDGRIGPRGAASSPPTVTAGALLPAPGGPRPTFVLFQNGASSVERQFLEALRREGPARDRDDLRVVLLSSL